MSDTKAKTTNEEKVMNEAREKSMSKFEDLCAEPPPYSSRPPSTDAKVTNGDVQDAPPQAMPTFGELDFQPSPLELPTPAACIAHLKLLHAFARLRQEIGNREGLFGILTEPNELDEVAKDKIDTAATDDTNFGERIRDKKWTVFVTKAVARFEKWWDLLSGSSNWYGPIRTSHFEVQAGEMQAIQNFPVNGLGYEDNESFRLPPLDVLMVWHAYMLNPRVYLEDSVRYTKQTLWRTPFPWVLVYASIDNDTFDYNPGSASHFKQTTGLKWDPLHEERLATVKCPQCCEANEVPWSQPPAKPGREALEAYLAQDTGFAGAQFEHSCYNCKLVITHEKLRVGKFCDDAQSLLDYQRPLAGTILNAWGEPAGTTTGKKIGTHDAFYPHRVIENRPYLKPVALRQQMNELTVEALKQNFQITLRSHEATLLVNAQQKKPHFIARGSRVAVRKVLSHYWDNSSVFGIDLVGAVLRQGTFVQKMTKLDWLHSPGVMSTVQRLIVKYHRFVRLAGENPKKTVVPTLDVDLAWHTHQLTPKTYYTYTLAETRKFLNHDDKIPESSLHTSFQFTSAAYEKKYAQPYSECSCWYCECTREPLRSNFLSKLSARRSSLSVSTLETKGFTKSPHDGAHVSAHNALPLPTPSSAAQKRRDLEALDIQYAKVIKRYQKSKASEPPKRDDKNDAYIYGAYGYPMYYPVYVPYYADPSACHYHSSAGAGGGGGCAAGTCAGSTSLGGCAGGDGTPGCQASCGGHGDAAGGCGSCGGGGGGGCGGCGS